MIGLNKRYDSNLSRKLCSGYYKQVSSHFSQLCRTMFNECMNWNHTPIAIIQSTAVCPIVAKTPAATQTFTPQL